MSALVAAAGCLVVSRTLHLETRRRHPETGNRVSDFVASIGRMTGLADAGPT